MKNKFIILMYNKGCKCSLIFFQHYSEEQVRVCQLDSVSCSTCKCRWTLADAASFFYDRKLRISKYSEPYVYIRVPERDQRELPDIIAEYLEFSKEIYTGTLVDPKRIGSLQDTAMYIFQQHLDFHRFNLPNAIPAEGNWLHYSHRGGLQWANKGFYGKTWKYDFTSFYPSICHSDALFPIGRPEKAFLQVGTEAELDLSLPAIYRVIMESSHPLLVLQPIDKSNQEFVYVTNLDLQTARLLGVSFKLAEYTKSWGNCMAYKKEECVAGGNIFGAYVDKFFALKKAGSKSGKFMLNVLTGLLVQKEKVHKVDKSIGSDVSIDVTNSAVQQLTPEGISYFSPNQQIFRRPDKARMGVFITAYGRHRVVKLLIDHGMMERLVQVHTDGFHLTRPLTDCPELERHAELGGLKLEHEGTVRVYHVNKVVSNT